LQKVRRGGNGDCRIRKKTPRHPEKKKKDVTEGREDAEEHGHKKNGRRGSPAGARREGKTRSAKDASKSQKKRLVFGKDEEATKKTIWQKKKGGWPHQAVGPGGGGSELEGKRKLKKGTVRGPAGGKKRTDSIEKNPCQPAAGKKTTSSEKGGGGGN